MKFCYKDSDLVLVLIDLSKKLNLESLKKQIQEAREYSEGSEIILVGTKADTQIVDDKEITSNFFYTYCKVSVKEGTGVDSLLSIITHSVKLK